MKFRSESSRGRQKIQYPCESFKHKEELATKRADAVASGMIKAKKKGLFKEKVKQVMVANKVKKQLEDNMVGFIKQDRVKMMFEQGERTSGSAADIAARLAKKKAARENVNNI